MKEMEELLDFLQDRDDYAIFAGFAAQILVDVRSSADIDVLVEDMKTAKKMAEDLGWKEKPTKYKNMITVKKNKIEFDICTTTNPIFIETKQKIEYEGRKLNVISPESLFLTKLNCQVAMIGRPEDKTKRDREVIKKLRTKIDVDKLKSLISQLKDDFWTERKW